MKTIINFIKKAIAWTEQTMLKALPYDKCLHLIAGLVIFTVLSPILGQKLALTATVLAAIAKDTYDKFIKSTKFDWLDIAYTIAPAVYIILYNYLMKL